MKRSGIYFIFLTMLLLSCKNEVKKKHIPELNSTPKYTQSKLDKLKSEGLIIVDTIIGRGLYAKSKFTVKFDFEENEIFIFNSYSELTPEFQLFEYTLYNGTNNKGLFSPDVKTIRAELTEIKPTPKFILSALLPDSNYNYEWRKYIQQKLVLKHGTIEIENELVYTPPLISQKELDSLILEYDKRPYLDQVARKTVSCVDERYFVKIFLASIQGNKKCEEILYNLTDKFTTDGSISESWSEFVYLDKLLKNKE